jgi:hypothetical protein
LALARELPVHWQSLLLPIQSGLFEHYEPYREAIEDGSLASAVIIDIGNADAIWPHVHPVQVSIERGGSIDAIEIALQVDWDEEHTLGVEIESWSFVGICGSVLVT